MLLNRNQKEDLTMNLVRITARRRRTSISFFLPLHFLLHNLIRIFRIKYLYSCNVCICINKVPKSYKTKLDFNGRNIKKYDFFLYNSVASHLIYGKHKKQGKLRVGLQLLTRLSTASILNVAATIL